MDTASLSVQELTAYLEHVMETESSLFKQRRIKEEAQKTLRYEEPEKISIQKPKIEDIPAPKPPHEIPSIGSSIAESIVCGFCGLLAIAISIEMFRNDMSILLGTGILLLGLYLLCRIPVIFEEREQCKEDKVKYDLRLAEYKNYNQKLQEQNAQAQQKYEQQVEAEEERHKLAVTAAKDRYLAAKEQVAMLDKPLAETESVLQSLYDTEILFPKYRNFPAVCMFYEYFASGRCSELAGPNGAYNLYESELRQNLIINQLDTIMGSLEGIKQNQFILYTEAKKTADALPGISRDITNMLDSSQQITQSAAIAAQCAEATKTNTEALKYLAFIKR